MNNYKYELPRVLENIEKAKYDSNTYRLDYLNFNRSFHIDAKYKILLKYGIISLTRMMLQSKHILIRKYRDNLFFCLY